MIYHRLKLNLLRKELPILAEDIISNKIINYLKLIKSFIADCVLLYFEVHKIKKDE
jgi:hypothetical protein